MTSKIKKSFIWILFYLLLSQFLFAGTQNVQLSKKWNLVGSELNNVAITQFDNSSAVSSVWTWDVQWQKWKGWSPNNAIVSLMQQYQMDIVSNIDAGEGFWVNASAPWNVALTGSSPTASTLSLSKKWNLISVNTKITTDDLNKAEILSVWTWDVEWQKWKGWSPNSAIVSLMQQYQMDIVSNIDAGEGFWVNASAPLDIKFGESVKSGYYVYQYLEGSAPIPLSNVEIYKILDNGSFSDLEIVTDSTGYASVNVPDNTALAFVKEGFSTINYNHKTGEIVNLFMTQSSEKNLQLLMPPSVGVSSSAVKKSAEAEGKSLQSPDSTATVTFYKFEVKDEYKDYTAKLSYIPGKNLKPITDNGSAYVPVGGVELTLATETGGVLFESFANISSNEAAYATGSIQLDEKLSDFLNQIVNQKKASELKLFMFDPSNPLQGWQAVNNGSVTLNAESNTLSFQTMDRFAFYMVGFSKPKELEQEVYLKTVDSDNGSIVLSGVNINILGQTVVTDDSGMAKIKLILPAGGTVKIEAFYTDDYNPYKGFFKVGDLKNSQEASPILLFLDKKNKENVLTLKVKNSSDNSSVPFANLKIYTYTSLGNVNHDGEYIYIGKEPGAEYSWYIKAHTTSSATTASIIVSSSEGVKTIKVSASPMQITGESSAKISVDSIVNFLKEKYSGDIVGDFDVIAHVEHVNGYSEEGTIGLLDLQFNGEEMLGEGSSIQITDNDNILNIDTDEWIFDFNNVETVNIWKGCLFDNGTAVDNCTDFNYETLVKDDLIEFLSENAQFILSHTNDSLMLKLQGYSCTEEGQDLSSCQSATVTIPLITTGDILDVYTDIMPATDIPAIIETSADANGEFPFIVPVDTNGDKLPSIVVNASKVGFKTAKGKKVLTDTEEFTIALKKLQKIDYTITVSDSDTTDAITGAKVTLSEALLDNSTGKLKDVKGSTDSDGKVVFNNVVEGIHNLIVFKDGYDPYEGKIRVSEKISSKKIKLDANSELSFDNLVSPFIEFQNPVIINGELLIKGKVYDTDNDTYSGATKLQVKFNDSVDSLDIGDDGSFQFRKALLEGRNSINLVAINPKGKFGTGTMYFYYKAIEQEKVIISGNLTDVINGDIEFTNDSYVWVTLGDDEIEFPIGDNNSFSMILKGVSDGDTVLINAVAYDEAGNVYYGDEQVEVQGEEMTGVEVEVKTETNSKIKEAYDEKHDDLAITNVKYSLQGVTYIDLTGVDKVYSPKVLIKAYLNAYMSGFTKVSATIENSKGFLDVSDQVSDNSTEGSIGFPLNLAYGENIITITVTNPPTEKHPEPYQDSYEFTIVYNQLTAGVVSTIPFTFKFVDQLTGKAPEKDLTVFIEKPETGEIINILDSWKLKNYFKKYKDGFIEPKETAVNSKFTLEIESSYYKDLKIFVDLANDKSIDNVSLAGKQVKYKLIDLPVAGQFGVGKEEGITLAELQNSGHVEVWPEPETLCKGTDGNIIIDGWFDIPAEHLKYKVFVKSDNETYSTEPTTEITGKFHVNLLGGKSFENGDYDVKVEAYYLDNMTEPIGTAFTQFSVEDCGEGWEQPGPIENKEGINPFHPPLVTVGLDNTTTIDGSFTPETGKIEIDNSSADCVEVGVMENTGGYYEFEITGKKAGYCSAIIVLYDKDNNNLESIPVKFMVKGESSSCKIKEAVITKTVDITGTAGGIIGFKASVSLPEDITCDNCTYIWDLNNNGKVDGTLLNTNTVTAYYGESFTGTAVVHVFDSNKQCIAKGSINVNLSGDSFGVTPPQALDLIMFLKNSTIELPACSCEGAENICSFDNLNACNIKELCEQFGGYWDEQTESCKAEFPCSEYTLNGCTDEQSCKANNGVWMEDAPPGEHCVDYDFIISEDVCVNLGGYWYFGKCHKEAFQGECSSDNLENCISPEDCKNAEGLWLQLTFTKGECLDVSDINQEDICKKAGGYWDINKCYIKPPTDECNPDSIDKCFTKESCENLGQALWIVNNFGNGKCVTLEDLKSKLLCLQYGGYWYNEECNNSPNQCSSDNLTGCNNKSECFKVGGYWYDNQCNAEEQTGTNCSADNVSACLTEEACNSVEGYWYNNECNETSESGKCSIDTATVTKTGDITGTNNGNIGFKASVSLEGITCDNCTYIWDLDNDGKVDGKLKNQATVTAFYGQKNSGAYSGKAVVYVLDSDGNYIAKGELNVDLSGDLLGATPPTTVDTIALPVTPDNEDVPTCQ